MQVIVDGLLTNYKVSGTGKTVLLLHGWGDNLETYKELTNSLEKKYRVVSIDLPGFGKTQAPREAWDLSNYAYFLKEFFRKTEINKIYSVIGHSNGGALSIHAISVGAFETEKLVLLAASGVRDASGFKMTLFKILAKIGKIVTFWLPDGQKKRLQKRLYGTIGSDMLAVPELRETFKLTVRHDVQNDAKNITVPTVLIYGSNDRATPAETIGKRLHSLIPNSSLHVLSGAEHFVHHDQPANTIKLIEDFLR